MPFRFCVSKRETFAPEPPLCTAAPVQQIAMNTTAQGRAAQGSALWDAVCDALPVGASPQDAKTAAHRRGFCNKKRGEKNEKDEVESFDIIIVKRY